MSVFKAYKSALDDAEFMMGTERGRLAVTLDILTDTLIVAGAHAVHCRHPRRADAPSEDVQTISKNLNDAKHLIQSVIREIEQGQQGAEPNGSPHGRS